MQTRFFLTKTAFLLPTAFILAVTTALPQTAGSAPAFPVFAQGAEGEFTFDTGQLRGKLRAAGKSLGLSTVVHVPSGKRLDSANGLLSHYRVFTEGVRYGPGAWDWPSEASLVQDGAVQVRWPVVAGRPFELRAVYRWRGPGILDVESVVQAERDLAGFESFLACYFSERFTNAAMCVTQSPEHNSQPGFLPARSSYGPWLMFPRDSAITALIQDGRWKLEPHPVAWTLMPALSKPIVWRRDPDSGLTAVLMSPPSDCFAIASPHQTEGHYSVYLSLFGRNLKPQETARARVRLLISVSPSEEEILNRYTEFLRDLK